MQTQIVPVQVYPSSANTLYIRAGNLGPPPAYYYELQHVETVPGKPGKPAVVDLVTGEIKSPEVPGMEDQQIVTVLKNGNVNMTMEQWQNWAANLGPEGDAEYQLDCIAADLGLTRE